VQAGDVDRPLGFVPRVTRGNIIGHPQLPAARKIYLDRFLALYSGDPFTVRLLLESGRFLVHMMIIVLETVYDPAARETWLTVGLLKQTLSRFGIASGRHLDHLIARLCSVGFVESTPSAYDRRVRILAATDSMRAHDRAWMAAHFAPLALLYPQYDYGLALPPTREFQAIQKRFAVDLLPTGFKLYLSEPDMLLFLDRAAGYPVLAALLAAAMDSEDYPRAAVPFAEVGERFGVSRTHVRKLLVAAEESGLVKLHAGGGPRVEILPRLWASHDRGIAGGMFLHDVSYVAACRHLDGVTKAPSGMTARSRSAP
jgi:hypothetical protein